MLLSGSVLAESCSSQALDPTHVPPAGLGSGMGPGPGAKVVGHQGAGTPDLLRDKLADATGYPLPPPSFGKPIPLGVSDGSVGAAFEAGARETRSGCEMTTSPTADNRDKTARHTLYTVRY